MKSHEHIALDVVTGEVPAELKGAVAGPQRWADLLIDTAVNEAPDESVREAIESGVAERELDLEVLFPSQPNGRYTTYRLVGNLALAEDKLLLAQGVHEKHLYTLGFIAPEDSEPYKLTAIHDQPDDRYGDLGNTLLQYDTPPQIDGYGIELANFQAFAQATDAMQRHLGDSGGHQSPIEISMSRAFR